MKSAVRSIRLRRLRPWRRTARCRSVGCDAVRGEGGVETVKKAMSGSVSLAAAATSGGRSRAVSVLWLRGRATNPKTRAPTLQNQASFRTTGQGRILDPLFSPRFPVLN